MTQRTRTANASENSTVTQSVQTETRKSRRSHTKSRRGCAECKRRHIRCDERQPSCSNCEASQHTCIFPSLHRPQRFCQQNEVMEAVITASPDDNPVIRASAQSIHKPVSPTDNSPLQTTTSSKSGHSSIPPGRCFPDFSDASNPATSPTFTAHEMWLLYHANSTPSFTGPNRIAVDIAVQRAFDCPYLLDEIIAYTAFHIIHEYPGSANQLQQLATELQTRALSSFTKLTNKVPAEDKATAIPRFLFSSILGRHMLSDTLVYGQYDFESFIDRLVECLNLNRGIIAVTPPARQELHDSEIEPIISLFLNAEKRVASPGTECNALYSIISNSGLGAASTAACRQAIGRLQWSFDICKHLDEIYHPQTTSVFFVGLGAEFTDELRKRRPEALIIMAYFGILLFRCRSFWPFRSTSSSMIHGIANHLGGYWIHALEWPLHVLETERG